MPVRIVQHVFAEIALRAVGARGGVAADHVAILAARHIARRADRNPVGAADRIVILAEARHRNLAALRAGPERQRESGGNAESCQVTSPAKFHSLFRFSSLPGLTRQSIENKAIA